MYFIPDFNTKTTLKSRKKNLQNVQKKAKKQNKKAIKTNMVKYYNNTHRKL